MGNGEGLRGATPRDLVFPLPVPLADLPGMVTRGIQSRARPCGRTWARVFPSKSAEDVRERARVTLSAPIDPLRKAAIM
jgi:hypothetical protein